MKRFLKLARTTHHAISRRSPPLRHNTTSGIRDVLRLEYQVRRAFNPAILKLEVVVFQKVDHDRLDVGRSGKAAR